SEEPSKGRGRGFGGEEEKPHHCGKGPSPPEEPFAGFKLKPAESIGSSAVFECEVTPSTAITSWMKDGGNLREGPKHKFISDGKDRKLHIIDVQLSDTGEYTCVAKNAGKEISCTANSSKTHPTGNGTKGRMKSPLLTRWKLRKTEKMWRTADTRPSSHWEVRSWSKPTFKPPKVQGFSAKA
uniref:Ig-like domain-containing protein n=1 Tax=Cyprinodon variegatus TaxID=28743 RepID=A0A3Q2DRX2_CYPVA